MSAPINPFKAALRDGRMQIGCWLSIGDETSAEIMGTAGFDWLVVDGEHTIYDIRAIRRQLIVLAASGSHPVVRVPAGESWILKQVLDAGAQSVLVPLVESADQARALVSACRYPPQGHRGVGGAGARATRFSAIPDYVTTANDQICVLVQVETRPGLAALDDILAVDGVDGVFIGPADLAAALGHPGQSDAPEVVAAIRDALTRIRAAGKAAGILGIAPETCALYRDFGAQFLAVGMDALLLAGAARALARQWRD
ncbi:MAG: HpcH/HpaI aldolase/citrate lyase family protein [Marinibacterium sp.]|nr:HpcH/HpaI aldolase/citrate lyase family protein [Marinibacterium sp.]